MNQSDRTQRAPRLDVVIVNYNTADLLIETLEDLPRHLPPGMDYEVFVADNASSDDSVARVRKDWPDVRLVEMGYNAGFCRANNAAIREGDAEFVLLVNTDTRLFDETVPSLLEVFAEDPAAGAVGPRLEFADGRYQQAAAGAPLTLRSYLSWMFGLERFAGRFPFLEGTYLTRDHGERRKVGWVCSACMLLRRSAIEQVGLMDEEIFLYMDDVDLCHRLGAAGWSTWYCGDVRAVHFMSGGERRKLGTISPYTVDSITRWFVRHHGARRTAVLRSAGFAAHGARGLVHGSRYLLSRSERDKDRSLLNFRLARYYIRTGVEPFPAGRSPRDGETK
ncbi:MAG: glycosyltransferase family 2 protein [Microthrixaceae bacterium]